MKKTITFTLTPEAQNLLSQTKTVEARVLQAIGKAMDYENALTVSHIQEAYLSFPRGGQASPIGLRVQTNSLRRSLRWAPAVVVGQRVRSSIGNNVTSKGVNYAAVHEFGAHIPAHTVRADNARALHFFVGGNEVFAKSAKIPAITLPARSPIRRGINDRISDYSASISAAIVEVL
jgi:hypothetical protein